MADILPFPAVEESMLACCSCENADSTGDVTPLIPIIKFNGDVAEVVGMICPDCGSETKVENGLLITEATHSFH